MSPSGKGIAQLSGLAYKIFWAKVMVVITAGRTLDIEYDVKALFSEWAIHRFLYKITTFMLLIWATAYIHPMCSSTRSYSPQNVENLENSGSLKNCENLRENSGKIELLWKKPGQLRENEKYVT